MTVRTEVNAPGRVAPYRVKDALRSGDTAGLDYHKVGLELLLQIPQRAYEVDPYLAADTATRYLDDLHVAQSQHLAVYPHLSDLVDQHADARVLKGGAFCEREYEGRFSGAEKTGEQK